MTILGISAYYHDSAAALVEDGRIVAAAQEERFSRKKHDASFPIQAVRYCLHYSGRNLSDVDAVVFYDKPFLKFERLLETYYGFSPKGWRSFITSMPIWIKEKIFLKRMLREALEQVDGYHAKIKFLFPEHHLSHAASTFFSSAFPESAILTIDGVGEWATASIALGKNNTIEPLRELHFPHSVGLLYSAFTYFLGFKVNSGEYKLMGLAPYGNPNSESVRNYIQIIKDNLVDIQEDGSIHLHQNYFNYAVGLTMIHDCQWEKLFGFSKRESETELRQEHADLACAIQQVTEEIVLKMAREAKRLTGSENLCLAGGVALNCVANGKLQQSKLFQNIFIQPASGDAGGALGAALAAYHIYYDQPRNIHNETDHMQGAYLGPSFSSDEVELVLKKHRAPAKYFSEFDALCEKTAQLIQEGNVVGWMQGRMEFGPRALGNRSILADARAPEIQKRLNLKIKKRESFRPFAPSVMAEDAADYFDLKSNSPYMLLTVPVKESRRNKLSDNYYSLPMMERLNFQRSDIPAVTHLDFSARVQTVHNENNPKFYRLLQKFKEQTGCSLLVNTSFNRRGEPPVCTPEDAYRCFMQTDMDYLVMENYLLCKTEQPEWLQRVPPEKDFILD